MEREAKTLADKVAQVERERKEALGLCGEMIATLKLPQNEKPLDEAGLKVKEVVDRWSLRLSRIEGG